MISQILLTEIMSDDCVSKFTSLESSQGLIFPQKHQTHVLVKYCQFGMSAVNNSYSNSIPKSAYFEDSYKNLVSSSKISVKGHVTFFMSN